jgi:hypothetical protein
VEWVQVGGWQTCRAGVSVQNKRGSERVIGRCAEWVWVQAQGIKGGTYWRVEWVWVHT